MFPGALSLPLFLLHSPLQRIFEDTYGQPWIPDHLYIVIPACILGSLAIFLCVSYLQKHGYWKRLLRVFVAE